MRLRLTFLSKDDADTIPLSYPCEMYIRASTVVGPSVCPWGPCTMIRGHEGGHMAVGFYPLAGFSPGGKLLW